MSLNLMDAAKGLFTNELIGKASSFLGESESGVTKAVGGILPTVLSSLVSKVGSTDGANTISNLVQEQSNSGVLDNLGSFFGNEGGGMLNKGAGLLGGLFGDKIGGITSLLSNFAGLKGNSITSLLSMALPAVLGLIGKHSSGGASGIASLLSGQKDNIAAAMPSGLNLSSVFGNIGGSVSDAKATATHYATETVEKSGSAMRYLLPFLLLAAAAIGAYYMFGKGCKGEPAATTETTEVAKDTNTVIENVISAVKESFKVKLVNGVEIDAYKGGIESQLVAFLDDKSAMVDTADKTKNWYDFDNLNFKLGKADLTDSSMVQIKNIVAILNAYPAVKMKIGGYTDASGDAAANLKLSQTRADAVSKAIVAAGGNAAQIVKAEGYGSQFAKEPATASDEARRKDRRTAVRIVAK